MGLLEFSSCGLQAPLNSGKMSIIILLSIAVVRGLYVFLLFMSMISLNTIFSAQCGLVPDLIQPSQQVVYFEYWKGGNGCMSHQGSASGIVAVHQLTGSITGFLVVLLTRSNPSRTYWLPLMTIPQSMTITLYTWSMP